MKPQISAPTSGIPRRLKVKIPEDHRGERWEVLEATGKEKRGIWKEPVGQRGMQRQIIKINDVKRVKVEFTQNI